MGEIDPHIHVERSVVRASAAVRDVLASAFGLVADPPSRVTTGCGIEVPYAMTSPRPESVTCLACREHAHREHLSFADQVERLSGMAGSTVTSEQGAAAAKHHRDLAARFAA
ncbi:hypothetical protein [Phytohabitans suffuscus]|uniref:Uncharacterized protein n=1 Tax=Phytohabitans suffuscus TaxID=624315 RepID=A0A6F8YXT8_9ACTN|nr:hypothetical protein [Phytohabitans suffuscus]BCB90758.1 hypothetical protein Psuf_080710 [Phytohabitans suffuscus]